MTPSLWCSDVIKYVICAVLVLPQYFVQRQANKHVCLTLRKVPEYCYSRKNIHCTASFDVLWLITYMVHTHAMTHHTRQQTRLCILALCYIQLQKPIDRIHFAHQVALTFEHDLTGHQTPKGLAAGLPALNALWNLKLSLAYYSSSMANLSASLSTASSSSDSSVPGMLPSCIWPF